MLLELCDVTGFPSEPYLCSLGVGNSISFCKTTSQASLCCEITSGIEVYLKCCRDGPSLCCSGSSSPSKKWYPVGVFSHHTPSPGVKYVLTRLR